MKHSFFSTLCHNQTRGLPWSDEAAYLLWLIFYHPSLPQQDAALFDCGFLLIFFWGGVRHHFLLFIWNLYKRQFRGHQNKQHGSWEEAAVSSQIWIKQKWIWHDLFLYTKNNILIIWIQCENWWWEQVIHLLVIPDNVVLPTSVH